jgi:hypothetical protein
MCFIHKTYLNRRRNEKQLKISDRQRPLLWARDDTQSGDLATTVYRFPHRANYYAIARLFTLASFSPLQLPVELRPVGLCELCTVFASSALCILVCQILPSNCHLRLGLPSAVLTVRSLQGYQSCRTLIPPFAPPINI